MDVLALNASVQSTPSVGSPSGLAQITTPVYETQTLVQKIGPTDVNLTSDSPYVYDFGQLTGATFVYIKLYAGIGSPLLVTLTWTNSDDEEVEAQFPVDDLLILTVDSTRPITGLTLQRAPATNQSVEVFLGQAG